MRVSWYSLQAAPFYLRWPIKWAVFAIVFVATLYPYPNRLVRHIQHEMILNQLPDPKAPELAPVRQEFTAFLSTQHVNRQDPQAMLRAVNAFVCRRIPYAWDWDVWGVADYVPTIPELLAKGREDCDGRAVLAAALLRAEGIPADLVGDTRHMWVRTPMGETMDPLGPPIMQTHAGKLEIAWARLLDLGPPAFGVAVFPLVREVIILVAAWVLLLGTGVNRRRAAIGLALLAQALLIIRMAGRDPIHPHMAGICLGLANAGAALAVLWSRTARCGVPGAVKAPTVMSSAATTGLPARTDTGRQATGGTTDSMPGIEPAGSQAHTAGARPHTAPAVGGLAKELA